MVSSRPLVLALAGVLCAVSLPPPASAGGEPVMAGRADCRFAVPEGWPTRGLRWSGECKAGWASGRGTLRAYDGTRVVLVYYGRLEDGQLLLGVVERPDGFVAGRFESGRVVNDGDRNTLIRAFDEASQAAREMAERFRRTGNPASARYYDGKSRQLAQQID